MIQEVSTEIDIIYDDKYNDSLYLRLKQNRNEGHYVIMSDVIDDGDTTSDISSVILFIYF